MLQVPDNSASFPLTLTGLDDLNGLASPAQNLVNGYNIAEQTCFHKTTVSNLIAALTQLSAAFAGLDDLLQKSKKLVSDGSGVASGAAGLVSSSTALLGNATTVGSLINIVSTVGTLIGTLVTLVGNIVKALTTIRDGALVAAIAAGLAGISCALFFALGPVPLAIGAIAIAALLGIVFLVIRNNVNHVMNNLGSINSAVSALTPPLATLTGSLGAVGTALGTLTPPLMSIATSLTDVGSSLNIQQPLMVNTSGTMSSRRITLQNFLGPSPAGAYAPRAHLEDAYKDAVGIYQAALNDLPGVSSAVWTDLQNDVENKRQIYLPGAPNQLDRDLKCANISIPPIG